MKSRVLVTRFSAMGDVAMVASVLKELQQQHNSLEIIMVSRALFAPFFEGIPNLTFHPFFPDEQHKGVTGIWKLFQELKHYHIDYVADLHNNIRSGILNLMFKTAGIPISILDKGRSQKKALTRTKRKIKRPLEPTVERYADVFRKLGFNVTLNNHLTRLERPIPDGFQQFIENGKQTIGIAPFAQHPFKVWDIQNWPKVFEGFSSETHQFIIFGGGNQEKEIASSWETEFPHVISAIGTIKLRQELDLISYLDYMISMDSSGMHMASLIGIRCLSLWGATHPYAGFLGYGQSIDDCIQVEHPNRPSSVYGNKSCICDGKEAIDLISVDMVIETMKKIS